MMCVTQDTQISFDSGNDIDWNLGYTATSEGRLVEIMPLQKTCKDFYQNQFVKMLQKMLIHVLI